MSIRHVVASLVLLATTTVVTANPINCADFLRFGGDPNKTRLAFKSNPEQMAWQWFVCLNVSGSGPRLWESFKPTSQVYLPNGATPAPYANRGVLPPAVISQARLLRLRMDRPFHLIDSTQQVDGLIVEMGGSVPAAQQGKPVRFQLLMGRDTFEYILSKSVYNVNGQTALQEDLNFPTTAWELKTSWLWIGTDSNYRRQLERDGYYIVQAYYPVTDGRDGRYEVGYAALGGMHVINKLFDNWVWTTFENKNNSRYAVTNAVPPTPQTNTTGPTPAAAAQNALFQRKYPGLGQYALIGVQWQAAAPPKRLANSLLESAFQSNSSCMACHSTAAYSPQKGYFNFALPHAGGIAYPLEMLPSSAFAGYKRLDFVWSLKRAQWKR